MPSSRILIASNTLTTSAASVTFSSIPNTYTDLVLRISVRGDYTGDYKNNINVTFNSSSTSYSFTHIRASGTAVASGRLANTSSWDRAYSNSALTTSNTFSSTEIYIPNYAGSANKVGSFFGATEINSSTDNWINAVANLWQNSSAITSITLADGSSANFVSGSSFFLYGISNS